MQRLKARRIGVFGCGTIGSELARVVDSGSIRNAQLDSLFDINKDTAARLKSSLASKPAVPHTEDGFFRGNFDLVIEAASQQAARSIVVRCLEEERDVMLMSAGALADAEFLELVSTASSKSGARVYIPSGAVGGIDAIRSVRHLIDSITITSTKNPRALSGAPYFEKSNTKAESISGTTLLYEGSAEDAVKLFPANVNIAAVVSLAGIGARRTMVRVIADPSSSRNTHEIRLTGGFGEINLLMNNVPSPSNPKTSYLAVLSAIECLRSICEGGIKVGS